MLRLADRLVKTMSSVAVATKTVLGRIKPRRRRTRGTFGLPD